MSHRSAAAPHYPVLKALVAGLDAKDVFEFGCGGSTVVLSEAVSRTGGSLYTVDTRPLHKTNSTADQIQYDKWIFFQMTSEEALKWVSGVQFDLVFHDGAHDYETVRRDLTTIIPQVRKGGMLAVHDTMMSEVNRAVKESIADVLCSYTTLPYAQGLTLITIGDEV